MSGVDYGSSKNRLWLVSGLYNGWCQVSIMVDVRFRHWLVCDIDIWLICFKIWLSYFKHWVVSGLNIGC